MKEKRLKEKKGKKWIGRKANPKGIILRVQGERKSPVQYLVKTCDGKI